MALGSVVGDVKDRVESTAVSAISGRRRPGKEGRVNHGGGSRDARGRRGLQAIQPPPPPDPLTTGSIADGTFRLDPEQARKNPGKAQSAIAKAEFELFDTQFRPYLDEAIRVGSDESYVDDQADAAGTRIRKAFGARDGQAARQLSRSGQSATPDQQASLDRNRDIKRALAVAGGENNARVTAEQTQQNLLEGAFDIGTSFLKSGGSSLGSASNLKSNREANNDAIDAQQDARTLQTIGTIAGIAMAL